MSVERLRRVRERLAPLAVDALLVTTPSNRRWISGFTGSAGVLLISAERALIATDSRYWEQVARQAPLFELRRVTGATTEVAPELLEGTGGLRIGYEPTHLTMATYQQWTDAIAALPGAQRPQLVAAPGAIERFARSRMPVNWRRSRAPSNSVTWAWPTPSPSSSRA